jgi:uncharacterized membrane protein YedE/YeeE
MDIDWNAFTPGAALMGGALIGLAAALFALFNGRIAGISGILGGLLQPKPGDVSWRITFIAGLVLAPFVYQLFEPLPELRIDASTATLVIAGLLVGVGTRYGSGCTSGHGVCGLSRRSPRSLTATLTFMAAGFATVFVTRHLLGA